MFYPHADDENVAMGYANYNNHIQENDTMVTINENAFKTYMFANYLSKLDQSELLELLEESINMESLIDMARNVWELPFDHSEGKGELVDPDALLMAHSIQEEEGDCLDCPEASSWDDEDYDLISYDNEDEDEEFAPYDEYDDNP